MKEDLAAFVTFWVVLLALILIVRWEWIVAPAPPPVADTASADSFVVARFEIFGDQNPPPAVGDSAIVCAIGRTATGEVFLLAPAYVVRRTSPTLLAIWRRMNVRALCRVHALDEYPVRYWEWQLQARTDSARQRA